MRGASRSVSEDGAYCDFTPHGYQPTHPDKHVSSPFSYQMEYKIRTVIGEMIVGNATREY